MSNQSFRGEVIEKITWHADYLAEQGLEDNEHMLATAGDTQSAVDGAVFMLEYVAGLLESDDPAAALVQVKRIQRDLKIASAVRHLRDDGGAKFYNTNPACFARVTD